MSTLGIMKQALVLLSIGRSRISCQNMKARNRHSNHSLRLPNRAFSRWTRLALAAVLLASTRLAFATANYFEYGVANPPAKLKFVDAAWFGLSGGAQPAPGKFIGCNAFASLADAITAAAPGDTLQLAAGDYPGMAI